VFGTGSGYSAPPSPEQAARWDVRCVRGPLTARLLGIEPEKAITDAAWLINLIPRYAEIPREKSGVTFIPHWTSALYGAWEPLCKKANITYVDPHLDCDAIFAAIAHSELAIVESLHAAIIADYYRTPWIPVLSPQRILVFKWLDWCDSLNIDYRPHMLPPSDYFDCLVQGIKPRQANTELHEVSVNRSSHDIRRANSKPKTRGIRYSLEQRLRKFGSRGRKLLLSNTMHMRNVYPISVWNQRHDEQLVCYFEKLATTEPVLSSKEIRSQRIEQLNDAFFDMKKYYSHQ
jgi:succinoglycan biosynthesis protein ExoV